MKLKALLALCTLFLLSACSNTSDRPAPEPVDYDKLIKGMGYVDHKRVTRITNYRTQSWRYIDDNTILVKTNDEDSYLITFNAACRGLSEAQSIVAQRSGSSLKSHDRFQIRTYSTLTTSGRTSSCIIDDIYELKTSAWK